MNNININAADEPVISPMATGKSSIMIVAGELSGDMHAAKLVEELKQKMPGTHFFGVGGPAMRSAGVETLYDIREMAVMGFWAVLPKIGFFKSVLRHMLTLAKLRSPHAAILVDYPGFNLRLAEKLKSMNIKVIYYICPQVWAWNRRRIPKMAQTIDKLITIFPFEKKYFDKTGLSVTFVGHPLTEISKDMANKFTAKLPWHGSPKIALLPGSRPHVIRHNLPVIWAATKVLEKTHPEASFIIACPSPLQEQVVKQILRKLPAGKARCAIVTGKTREVLKEARAAIVTSGTATIEASMMECPMTIVYATDPITFFICKQLVEIENIGMVNIVAGRKICPEFIQNDATPEAIAQAVAPLLDESAERSKMINALREANESLGSGNVEQKAADAILETISPIVPQADL